MAGWWIRVAQRGHASESSVPCPCLPLRCPTATLDAARLLLVAWRDRRPADTSSATTVHPVTFDLSERAVSALARVRSSLRALHLSFQGSVRRGMIRYLYIIVDLSRAMVREALSAMRGLSSPNS